MQRSTWDNPPQGGRAAAAGQETGRQWSGEERTERNGASDGAKWGERWSGGRS